VSLIGHGGSTSYATIVSRAGPLTTTFTPPADCTGNVRLGLWPPNPSTSPSSPYGVNSYGVLRTPETCTPPRITTSTTWGLKTELYEYYSPGICPSGFTTAITPVLSCAATPLRPSETAVFCCRSGYSVTPRSDNVLLCTSTLTKPTLVTIEARGSDITATITPTVPIEVLDNPVYLIVAGALAQSTSAGEAESTSSLSGSGLSKDAKIAIGVAVPIVVIAIAATTGFYVFFRRRLAKLGAAGHSPCFNVPVSAFKKQPSLRCSF
jgi:hypothetical protein